MSEDIDLHLLGEDPREDVGVSDTGSASSLANAKRPRPKPRRAFHLYEPEVKAVKRKKRLPDLVHLQVLNLSKNQFAFVPTW